MKTDTYAFVVHDFRDDIMRIIKTGKRGECEEAMESFLKRSYLARNETAMIVKAIGTAVDG